MDQSQGAGPEELVPSPKVRGVPYGQKLIVSRPDERQVANPLASAENTICVFDDHRSQERRVSLASVQESCDEGVEDVRGASVLAHIPQPDQLFELVG